MLVQRITKKLQKKSNARPKSLVLHIPAAVRDIMGYEHGTELILDVIVEDDDKYVVMRKQDKEKEKD